MKIHVDHVTHYTYEHPVRYSTQYLRLVPQTNVQQRVLEWTLDAPAAPLELRDGYGNILHVLTIVNPVNEIVIRASGTVETSAALDENVDPVKLSPLVFLRPTALTRAEGPLVEFAERHRRRSGTLTGLRGLADDVRARLPFEPGVTAVHSTALEAFEAGKGGVCQDHAHVFIACCRHLGVPARYVSGYIYLPGNEAAVASHAWAEAWVVDRWRSFDVTNARSAGEDHIRLAIGADYADASPVRGMRHGGGDEKMSVTAHVTVQ